ncbi:hypothetical protein CAPTEDRAFT_218991 [Capitella teleta]|uniref:Transcription initiation factor IIE subunit beta n=1 Tax=Capitella teleta TaxID=283909 RepID=R7VIB7_CAPTE|nr:hypothetical protein CAPTEDRAFT_218991 [Capitella teleta]|eukprot:ELU18282.1 hypothetical protein CAPTEDRAFT_218991 [Capitella teleta]
MDPALLRERANFKARALAMPAVEKRKAADQSKSKSNKKARPSPKPREPKVFDYKNASGSSQYKFSILAKIVKHMRTKHQQGDNYPLSLEEILDETNQTDIGVQMRHWLNTEALRNNPKITVTLDDKFEYKPKFTIKGKDSLRRLLEKRCMRGQGGITMDDVEESLPNAQKAVKALGDQLLQVIRPIDKKVILYYNDKSTNFVVDEELQKLWRAVAVEGVDEKKMEEYLRKHGHSSMKDSTVRSAAAIQRSRRANRKKAKKSVKTKDNEHLGDILVDYSNGNS